ncbi:unnamed protein product [Schistosoma intercalatum]|nr:unnamed protein product [Schistosoma intercalatum]
MQIGKYFTLNDTNFYGIFVLQKQIYDVTISSQYYHYLHQLKLNILCVKIILSILFGIVCLNMLNGTLNCSQSNHHYDRQYHNQFIYNSNRLKEFKKWDSIVMITITIYNEILDSIEKIINSMRIYDPFIIPTCYGSLFQELVNLSHVIERKGEI